MPPNPADQSAGPRSELYFPGQQTLFTSVPSKVSSFDMSTNKTDLPHGTLDLLILTTLDTMGPMHGYSLARRIEQVSESLMKLSQGSVYPALIRLEQADGSAPNGVSRRPTAR